MTLFLCITESPLSHCNGVRSLKFTITNRMTQAITRIERARGFLDAMQLSPDWVRKVGEQALILEAHHTTHIEGTRLTLEQAERLWKGEAVPEADPTELSGTPGRVVCRPGQQTGSTNQYANTERQK